MSLFDLPDDEYDDDIRIFHQRSFLMALSPFGYSVPSSIPFTAVQDMIREANSHILPAHAKRVHRGRRYRQAVAWLTPHGSVLSHGFEKLGYVMAVVKDDDKITWDWKGMQQAKP